MLIFFPLFLIFNLYFHTAHGGSSHSTQAKSQSKDSKIAPAEQHLLENLKLSTGKVHEEMNGPHPCLARPNFPSELAKYAVDLDTSINKVLAKERGEEHSFIIVDAKAFINNIKLARSMLKKDVKLCVVLKSNAYGHGIASLAKAAYKAGADCMGIADNKEIEIIRAQGIDLPIIRLRPVGSDQIIEAAKAGWKVEEVVGSLKVASEISDYVLSTPDMERIKIHLNLNSGKAGREAFDLDKRFYAKRPASESPEAEDLFGQLRSLKGVEIKGIMSHFVSEDVDTMREGLIRFQRDSDLLIRKLNLNRKDITLHMGASPALTLLPDSQLDMVRIGSLLYAQPNMEGQLPPGIRPVMYLVSKLEDIQAIKKGQTIKDHESFEAPEDMNVGIIPIGYDNGIPQFPVFPNFDEVSIKKAFSTLWARLFTNKMKNFRKKDWVLIKGRRYPVLDVSQNGTYVDITQAENIQEGDQVSILGENTQKRVAEDGHSLLLARINSIYQLRKGDSIGYHEKSLPRDTTVASIPIGYAHEGYPDKKKHIKTLGSLPTSTLYALFFKKLMHKRIRPFKKRNHWVIINGQRFPVLSINKNSAIIGLEGNKTKVKKEDKVFFLGGMGDGDKKMSIMDIVPRGEFPDKIVIRLAQNMNNKIIIINKGDTASPSPNHHSSSAPSTSVTSVAAEAR